MSMILKKSQIITASLLIALCGAVFVNWYYSRPSSTSVGNLGEAELVNATATSTKSTTDKSNEKNKNETTKAVTKKNSVNEYFASSKLRRESAHDKARATLNAVITNKDSSKDAVMNATSELTNLSNLIKKEADLENIITAKLGSECVVILDEQKAEVIIANSVLKGNALSIIQSSVVEQTGLPVNNISIIGAK
ncbi:MAG: SpoIIIAH-like family protein [Oscillospiraceae bacterium]|nr:SpoIIIAH-like family protein [Oscillospiraceae bacterium]